MKVSPAHTACHYCGTALDALTRRRGLDVCGASGCRRKAADAHTTKLKQALLATAPDAVRSQLPHLKEAPAAVVWLQHCEPRMVALTDEDRRRHRAYLESVVADGTAIDYSRLSPLSSDDTHPQGARLCGQCRGRCCEIGASRGAFIDLPVLERWQQEQPEFDLADVVEAYLWLLPAEHVHDACLYQAASGCAIPRTRRADICNGFACDSLQQVQHAAKTDADAAVLAITFHKDQVERAAVIEAGATHAVALEIPQVST